MVEDSIEDIRIRAIVEIKEKVRKNPRFLSPCNKERLEYQEKLKFADGNEFTCWMQQNGIMKNPANFHRMIYEKTAENAGFKDPNEYSREIYKNNIEDNRRYARERLWNKGTSPMSENENCSSYLGVNIGERVFKEFLLTIFEYVKHMDYGNHGFDFICKDPKQEFIGKYPQFKLVRNKEYKIQLELRCLYYRIDHKKDRSPYWKFYIQNNDAADIFILLGLDDRESLQPIHSWLFYRDDMIRKGNSYTKREKFWKRDNLTITDNQEYLKYFKKYELSIDRLKELINKLKDEEEI